MNTIQDKRRWAKEWAIYPGGTPFESEAPMRNDPTPDPRVSLVLDDPRVGRSAYWGGGRSHAAVVRAVVLVDGVEESLLLEDWTGYPWIRVPPDAELRPVKES